MQFQGILYFVISRISVLLHFYSKSEKSANMQALAEISVPMPVMMM